MTTCAIKNCMTEISREGDIKLEVMNTDVGGKKKSKRQIMSNWTGRRKKKKQIEDWKKYTCRLSDCWKKIWKKKEKRGTRKCVWKKKKMNDDTNSFFVFSDFWVVGLLHDLLSCFIFYCCNGITVIFLINSTWGRAVQ